MSGKFAVTGDWAGHRPPHFPMNETYLRMPGGGGLGDLICFLGAAGIYAKLHPAERVFTNVLPEVIERYDPPVLDYHDCGHVAPLEVFEGQHRTKHQSPLRNYVGTFLSSMGEAIEEPPGMELPCAWNHRREWQPDPTLPCNHIAEPRGTPKDGISSSRRWSILAAILLQTIPSSV